MKVIFAVIQNNLSGDPTMVEQDSYLFRHFIDANIRTVSIKLSDLIGIGKMPLCLADWESYDAVVILCNSSTAAFFLNVDTVIHNAKLWALNWPKKIANSGNPEKNKFFDTIPQMSEAAKTLIIA